MYASEAMAASTATVVLAVSPYQNRMPTSAPIEGPTTPANEGRYDARLTTEPALMPIRITVSVIRLMGCAGSRNRKHASAQVPPTSDEPAADSTAHVWLFSLVGARHLKAAICAKRTALTTASRPSHASMASCATRSHST
jgi:hypothetical protein